MRDHFANKRVPLFVAAAFIVFGLLFTTVAPAAFAVGAVSSRAAVAATYGSTGAMSRSGSQHAAVAPESLPLATLYAVNEGAHGAPSGGPGPKSAIGVPPPRTDGIIGRWVVVFLLAAVAGIWVALAAVVVRVHLGFAESSGQESNTRSVSHNMR